MGRSSFWHVWAITAFTNSAKKMHVYVGTDSERTCSQMCSRGPQLLIIPWGRPWNSAGFFRNPSDTHITDQRKGLPPAQESWTRGRVKGKKESTVTSQMSRKLPKGTLGQLVSQAYHTKAHLWAQVSAPHNIHYSPLWWSFGYKAGSSLQS